MMGRLFEDWNILCIWLYLNQSKNNKYVKITATTTFQIITTTTTTTTATTTKITTTFKQQSHHINAKYINISTCMFHSMNGPHGHCKINCDPMLENNAHHFSIRSK
jgi:hypothetical protein